MLEMATSQGEGGNPLLQLHRRVNGSPASREEAVRRYAFAVPDDAALTAIERWARNGVVEIGAGSGYWAEQLHRRGVDVAAYDIAPAPSPDNQWYAGQHAWFPVQTGDQRMVADYPHRCLLIVWPTKNETWPAEAIELFHRSGGTTVVFVGEGPGGRSGDDRFHALIGELGRCYRCTLGLQDLMCICGTPTMFRAEERVAIPTWSGFDDSLIVLRRVSGGSRRPTWRRSRGHR